MSETFATLSINTPMICMAILMIYQVVLFRIVLKGILMGAYYIHSP